MFALLYGAQYGIGGISPVRDSAGQLTEFARLVRGATGADQVDVVGYSQGGLVLRTALRSGLSPTWVATAVLIAPSFHGTTSILTGALPASACPACADQVAGSALLTELATGGDLDGDVRYAVLSSRRDDVVTPVASQIPEGPADRVRSVVVEDHCTDLRTNHINLPAERPVMRWVVAALQSDGRPTPADLGCG